MKWFKHDSNAASDAKLRRLRLKYGMEGYGLYWYCLELIAGTVELHNLSFELEHDAELIAADTSIHVEKVQDIMRYMVNLGLFEQGHSGVISCQKMATRTDEYIAKVMRNITKCPESVRSKSGASPEKVRLIRREEKRRDIPASADAGASDFESFWQQYPKKVDKKKAESVFLRLPKAKREAAIADIKSGRYASTDRQFVPNPTTYLRGERWEDETGDAKKQNHYAGAI